MKTITQQEKADLSWAAFSVGVIASAKVAALVNTAKLGTKKGNNV